MKPEPSTQASGQPVWIRPPIGGHEFYTGLTRGKLYELAASGKIVTASIRPDGESKGTRLFKLQSVLDFIETQIIPPEAVSPEAENP